MFINVIFPWPSVSLPSPPEPHTDTPALCFHKPRRLSASCEPAALCRHPVCLHTPLAPGALWGQILFVSLVPNMGYVFISDDSMKKLVSFLPSGWFQALLCSTTSPWPWDTSISLLCWAEVPHQHLCASPFLARVPSSLLKLVQGQKSTCAAWAGTHRGWEAGVFPCKLLLLVHNSPANPSLRFGVVGSKWDGGEDFTSFL